MEKLSKTELTKIRKKAKSDGASFELRVRKDLTEKGWIVDKFGLNVEFDRDEATTNHKFSKSKGIITKEFNGGQWIKKITYGKLIQAKNKWAGPNRPMMMGAGFPDFLAFSIEKDIDIRKSQIKYLGDSMRYIPYEVIGVESKVNGYLDKAEREKCKWLLDNNIFSKILIARKTKVKNKIVVVYEDFESKYEK